MLAAALTLLCFQAPVQEAQAPDKDARLVALLQRIDPKRIERNVRELCAFGTRHTLSSTKSKTRGIGAARDYLENRLRAAAKRSAGRMTVTRERHEVGMRGGTAIEVVNLVATIKGIVEPERIYVVSGHYDSRNTRGRDGDGDAPGANDDGSGTAAVLELADVLADQELHSTLRLVCYDGEELGLLGSRADAGALAKAGKTVDGMLTMDICGNTEAQDGRRERGYVRAFSYQRSVGDSNGRNLARHASDCARRYLEGFRVKLIFRGDRFGRGGDHRPFDDKGWPAMRFTEPYENYSRQHKNVVLKDGKPYGDLPDFMDFAYLGQVTRLALCVAHELAMAPPAPARPRVRAAEGLSTSAFLRVPEPSKKLAGWEFVWRATTAADWEGSVFVPVSAARNGRVTARLANVLLDDSIVAVRSVATSGARSRTVSTLEPDSYRRRRR